MEYLCDYYESIKCEITSQMLFNCYPLENVNLHVCGEILFLGPADDDDRWISLISEMKIEKIRLIYWHSTDNNKLQHFLHVDNSTTSSSSWWECLKYSDEESLEWDAREWAKLCVEEIRNEANEKHSRRKKHISKALRRGRVNIFQFSPFIHS